MKSREKQKIQDPVYPAWHRVTGAPPWSQEQARGSAYWQGLTHGACRAQLEEETWVCPPVNAWMNEWMPFGDL